MNGLYGGGVMPGAQPMAPQAPQAPQPGMQPGAGGQQMTPEQLMAIQQMIKSGQYQLPPELIQQAARTSQQGLETGQLDRSMKLADQLRSDAGDQLKGVQAGRRFVAPGVANMAASLMGGMYGGQMAGDVQARRKAMIGEGQAGAEAVMNAVNAGR